MRLERAETMTETEARFLGIPPWIITGNCTRCGAYVQERSYGLRDELTASELRCSHCQKGETDD
jgi:hypothetical protein